MSEMMTATNKEIDIPVSTEVNKEIPTQSETKKKIPKATKPNKEIPPEVNPENCITLKDKVIEIKPTKLKYFRNRMASIYNVLKIIPLSEFLSYEQGTFDEDRNSDQILFDFLVSVFDDSDIVSSNYDDMTSEDIERILKIFSRLNHIEEKEEARKNREAQAKR